MRLSLFEKCAIGVYLALLGTLFIAVPVLSPHTGSAFFSWPQGSIWSNLLASAILGGPAILALFRQMERHHQAHLAKLQQHHDEIRAHLAGRT